MKIDHLEKRVNEYENSIKTVVQKKTYGIWKLKF